MDEVKKYLRENRHELDVESPPSKEVWQHIQQQVPARRKNVVQPMFRWVAAACILLLTGTAAYMLWNKPAPKDEVVRTTPIDTTVQNPEIRGRAEDSLAPAISPLPGEVIAEGDVTSKKNLANSVRPKRKEVRPATLKEKSPVDLLQESYTSIINVQLKKLERTPIHVESPGYFHAFKKQWYDMEKDEKKIKDDIKLYGLTDGVLTQFIQLYQQKLLLLKQLQDEINKMNSRGQQYPEMKSKSPSYLKM